jgi:amino acid adenylation domain-containing protein
MSAAPPSTLARRFLRGLERAPSGTAVRVGPWSATYTELHQTASLWAEQLAGSRRVAVLAEKGPTVYPGILAALYAGATVVPLRPDFPAARLQLMLEACAADVLIADDEGLAVLPALGDAAPALRVFAPLAATPPPFAEAKQKPAEPDRPAYILFTSGSTGRPKGVTLSEAGFEHYFALADARYDFTNADVFSHAFDLNFDCSVFDLFCAWGAGACALAVPPAAYRDLPGFLAGHGVTVWFSTPSAIELIRRTGGLGPGALPGLRWSFFAGEALQCRDAADWAAAAPGSVVENLYGPTELTVTVSAHRWSENSALLAPHGVVPIGEVHRGHRHLLLDPQGAIVEDEGELCIAGPQLTSGYLDPDDAVGRFLEKDGERYYRTGDRVRTLPGGELGYLGRIDSQLQIQGWRIEPGEVEHALRACGVRDAVVVGAPGPSGTELVVFHTGQAIAPAKLTRRLRQLLPDGALPRRFLPLEAFPLNANRKIDRLALAALAAGANTPAP